MGNQVLGLDICADIIIGDEMRRGISGGQKKRVTTGNPDYSIGELYDYFIGEHYGVILKLSIGNFSLNIGNIFSSS